MLYSLNNEDKEVVFLWVPSHIGIPGNEKADKAAKEAGGKEDWDHPYVPSSDTKNFLRQKVREVWTNEWIMIQNNKLREIKDKPNQWQTSYQLDRRDEVSLCRMRIGHSRLTHSYLMEKSEPPVCPLCQEPLSIKHLIESCPKFLPERRKYNIDNNIKEALKDDDQNIQRLLSFLKDTNLIKEL